MATAIAPHDTHVFGLPSATPFFQDKARAFWNLQVIGWSAWYVLRAVQGVALGLEPRFLLTLFLSTVTGFSLSLLLSVPLRHLMEQRTVWTWLAMATLVLCVVMVWAFLDAWIVQITNPAVLSDFPALFLAQFYQDAITLGAWSALYFAINYYLRLEQQQDELIRLEAQAASAQLTMLRYQLNPHFLFNTLNSISTLVMLGETEPANAMLTRLSSFLRYTLENEARAEVTVAQEVDTLNLYLAIEKMRFEERLRPSFEIDAEAARAKIPSMLLQPLVENAIKYAVSPQEDGAEIVVRARLVGDMVRLTVSDTGPGLSGPGHLAKVDAQQGSTGVGLVNTRERLMQAYGDRHRFETHQQPGGGFSVVIDLPLRQTSDASARETPPPS